MFRNKIIKEIKIYFRFIIFFENLALYEIIWRNMVQTEATDDSIIRRMRFECRTTKAVDTHSELLMLFHGKNI
jgi:hypothetical protein